MLSATPPTRPLPRPTASPDERPKRAKFSQRSGLRAELNRRVDAYFADQGVSRFSEGPRMWFKTALLIATLAASWTVLMVFATTWWQLVLLASLAGVALAGVGFDVMHDGSHGSYSHSSRWNRLMGATLDAIGGSSYVWRFKHNVLHHTYPNVEGLDDDIEAQPFLRMADGQRRYPWHRLQHYYVWLAYALLPVKWHFVDDFKAVFTGELMGQSLTRPRGWELALFWGGKLFFFAWALALPLAFHSVEWVVASYAVLAAASGITLGTVFQLAHCVESVEIDSVPTDGAMRLPWAEHQIATTSDFAPNSRFLTWALGGLNFQVEHHLFPRVGHVHYPALARIVRETCAEFGVAHHTQPSLWHALRGHVRHLRRLGLPVAAA